VVWVRASFCVLPVPLPFAHRSACPPLFDQEGLSPSGSVAVQRTRLSCCRFGARKGIGSRRQTLYTLGCWSFATVVNPLRCPRFVTSLDRVSHHIKNAFYSTISSLSTTLQHRFSRALSAPSQWRPFAGMTISSAALVPHSVFDWILEPPAGRLLTSPFDHRLAAVLLKNVLDDERLRPSLSSSSTAAAAAFGRPSPPSDSRCCSEC
jgi:hypothetical protein